MRLSKAIALALLFVGLICFGQQPRAYWQSRDQASIAAAAFQGPGDVVSGAVTFISPARAYSAAFAATAAAIADIVDTATGAATCTYKIATTGFADLSSNVCVGNTLSVTTFCTVTHAAGCSVTKLYDQTGTGNHFTDATLSNMPILSLSALGGLPCLSATTNLFGLASPSITQAQPLTISAVAERNGNFTNVGRIMSTVGGGVNMSFRNSTNTVAISGGTILNATQSDSAFHSLTGVLNGASSAMVIDGAATTGAGGAGTISSAMVLMNDSVTFNGSGQTGITCEAGIWPSAFNSTQYGNMSTNQHSAANGYNF